MQENSYTMLNVASRVSVPNDYHQQEQESRAKRSRVFCTSENSISTCHNFMVHAMELGTSAYCREATFKSKFEGHPSKHSL